MLVRSGLLVLGLALLSVPVIAADHGADGARTSEVSREASRGSLQALQKLTEMIELFDEMKRNGTPFADSALEDSIRLLAKRFVDAEDANSLLPGTKMATADQTVFFNNIEILYEYAVEIMSLQAADNLVPAAQLKKTAAENISKKWRVLGRTRRKSWTVASASDPLLGDFGYQEALRRELLIAQGNDIVFDRFVADLSLSLKGEFGPGAPASAPVTAPSTGAPAQRSVVDDIATGLKDKDKQADKLAADYEALRKEYQDYYDKNIRGKSGSQLTTEILNEAKKRSAALRQLEADIKATIGDLPADLSAAVDRFKQDPKKFVNEEYATFLVKLRARDPQKANDLERIVDDYQKKVKNLDALLNKYKGKSEKEIGEEALEAIRRQSAAVREIEGDVRHALSDIEKQAKKIEAEVNAKAEELRRRLDGQLRDFKNNDLRRIEGDLKGKLEDAKESLQRDLKDLGRIFGKN